MIRIFNYVRRCVNPVTIISALLALYGLALVTQGVAGVSLL